MGSKKQRLLSNSVWCTCFRPEKKIYTEIPFFFAIVGVHVKKLIVGLRYIKLTKKLLGYWLTDANSIHQTYHIDDRST